MTNLNDRLKDKTKFEFFASLADFINLSPIDIIEGDMLLTLIDNDGKLKLTYKEQERIIDYDDWVKEYGDYLLKDFKDNKLNINSQHNI
jgi:hypothetical protein